MITQNPPAFVDTSAEVAALIDTLLTAERRLDLLTAGEIDAIADSEGGTFLLRRAQEQLRQGESARQAGILNALPAHVALLDSQGIIISVNEGWRRFALENDLGQAASGVGQNYLQTCRSIEAKHSDDGEQVATGIEAILNGDAKNYSFEYRCDSPVEPRWFLLRVTALEQNGVRGAIVMHVDITARKLAEEALLESEARFRGTFEQAAVGMAHVSKEGVFLRVNRKLCDITGFPREELLRMTFSDVTLVEDRPPGLEALRAMLAGERDSYAAEKRYRRKDGNTIWVNVMVTLKLNLEGKPKGFITVVNDISARKTAEFRLHRLNRLHTVLGKMGEMVVRTRETQQLFDNTCRIVVEHGLLRMAVIAMLDATGNPVEFKAICGLGMESLAEVTVTREGPMSVGAVGTSIRTGVHDWCNDIPNEARMAPWQPIAAKHGFSSVASFPLKREHLTIGALVLYSSETGYFQDDELRLMGAVADELSFAIETQETEEKRQQIERALQASEANMAIAQGISHIGSWELVLEGGTTSDANPLSWSDEMFRIAGFEPGTTAITSGLFHRMIHPEDRESVRRAMAQAIARREEYSVVHRLVRVDGVERVLQESAQIFYDEGTGRPIKVIGTAHDITEQRQLTQQLEDERARLIAAQMVGRVGSWETNLATMTMNWSAETHRIFETDPAQFQSTQKDFINAVHPEDRHAVESAFADSLGERTPHALEHRVLLPDGRIKYVEERWQVFEDPQGAPERALGTCQDITERKKLESQFLRVQRMESIGTLASGIAHDLNNVLAPIMMSVEMLRDMVPSPEGQSMLVLLQNCAQRGANLVKQVLSFARGVEGRRVTVNVFHIIHDLENIIKDTFPKNILFEIDRPRELRTVLGDPTQLHQVFMNLCVNARDAMPLGGKLRVTLENVTVDEMYADMNPDAKAGPYTMVKIEDTGSGIPQSIKDKIFEPFFTTKEIGKGTGLGLSTTLAIVKSHGGFIGLYSEPNKGSQFKVYLPASVNPAVIPENLRESPPPSGDGELILVVDDEEPIRTVTQKTLERFNYRVLLASNGAEAVAAYAKHNSQIAVVLTDMAMPIMDGPAAIIALRTLNPDVKIIGCSGHASVDGIAKALGSGLLEFIPKPYTAETLLKALRLVLPRKTEQ